jgi:hypothetical protein
MSIYTNTLPTTDRQEVSEQHELSRRQLGGLLGGLGGLVGGLGGVVGGLGGGLGGVLGGLTSPLLGPLVGGLTGGGQKAQPQIVVVPQRGGGYGGWGGGANPYAQAQAAAAAQAQAQAQAQAAAAAAAAQQQSGSWASWFGGAGGGGGRPQQSQGGQGGQGGNGGSNAQSGQATVTVRGINVPCRPYPDDFNADSSKAVLLSAPAKLDAVCWSGSTPGTLRANSANGGRDDGWLRTKSNCYIKTTEVEEYREYSRLLQPCGEVRHWIGTLSAQYSRKDCYYCPSTTSCGSEDLGSLPYVDLLCFTNGDDAGGNTTWYKNQGKNCYFPGAVLEPEGFLGTPGGQC